MFIETFADEYAEFDYIAERKLQRFESFEIDTSQPIMDWVSTKSEFGISGKAVAKIVASSSEFFVIDRRGTEGSRDFLVIDNSCNISARRGFKGLSKGETVQIGRNHHQERFSYPKTVSRNHFEVSYIAGKIQVENLDSSNPTIVTAYELVDDDYTPYFPPCEMVVLLMP